MKKTILISTLISTTIFLFAANTQDEWLNFKLEPQYKYDENMQYQEKVKKYEKLEKDKKYNLDLGVDVDVNKEEKAIDRLKLDMGKKF